MEEIRTFYVKLNAVYYDTGGYIIYVFENLDYRNHELKYIMCHRFPNWDHADLNIGDRGYVNLRYTQEWRILYMRIYGIVKPKTWKQQNQRLSAKNLAIKSEHSSSSNPPKQIVCFPSTGSSGRS